MIELLSVNPARILNVPGGTLSEGAPADITILAPDLPVTIDASRSESKSKNTPFDGWELQAAASPRPSSAAVCLPQPRRPGGVRT